MAKTGLDDLYPGSAACSSARRQVFLLLGGDKSSDWNAWYERAVLVADDLYGASVDELKQKGLI